MIVAHRGASRDAPENTLPAFRLAWEQGADAIEGDFRLTRDGCIVCIRDDNTHRVSNTNAAIPGSTLAELRTLDVGVRFGEAYRGTVIPTLAEVFATIPDRKTIYIELKCGAGIIPPLLEQIRTSGLKPPQVVVIGFDKSVIQELKAAAPQFKALWLCHFRKDSAGKITPTLGAVLETLGSIKADGLSSNPSIPEPFIAALTERGYEWHVWTVDDPETAKRMKKLGAVSITSNTPAHLRTHLTGCHSSRGRGLGK